MKSQELKKLNKALYFLNVSELKKIIIQFNLPEGGNKIALINRIFNFIESGTIIEMPIIPAISYAKKGVNYPLHPETLIVKGAYKNDLATRKFFKNLIGEYFHFTAFGIDWINEKWLAGNPPKYREFSKMWQEEYQYRQKNKIDPKKEWAYINFTQDFLKCHPQASRNEIISSWKNLRQQQLQIVTNILKNFIR